MEESKVSEKDESCSSPENICIDPRKLDGKNHQYDAASFFESLKYALSGIKLIVVNERNFRIQLVILVLSVILGLLLRLPTTEWAVLAVVMTVVLVLESLNSVVEAVCDTISREYRVNIRYAKDVSAGAVLVGAVMSLITGAIIFLPKLWEVVNEILQN